VVNPSSRVSVSTKNLIDAVWGTVSAPCARLSAHHPGTDALLRQGQLISKTVGTDFGGNAAPMRNGLRKVCSEDSLGIFRYPAIRLAVGYLV